MKILHIINCLDVGGAEAMLERLIVESKNSIDQTHAVVSLTSLGKIGARLNQNGIKVSALGMKNFFDTPKTVFSLHKIIRQNKPDIVQTWAYHSDLLGGVTAFLSGVKKIVWRIQCTDVRPGKGVSRHTYFIARLCVFLSHFIPTKIICVAEAAKKTHAKLGYAEKKMEVIANGYSLESELGELSKLEIRKSLGISAQQIVVGSVGRFNEYKDHKNFILAAKKIADKKHNVLFLMLGRGIDKTNTELMNWINDIGCADKFVLLGERDDVHKCLSAMDVFCLHSVSEGFPNVVCEAMLAGAACVVTDVGDASIILGDAGLIVPPQNSHALADALLKMTELSQSERNTITTKARERIEKNYSMAAIKKQYDEMYSTVLKQKNIDAATVDGFGDEWTKFDQSELPNEEKQKLFAEYFAIFPWEKLATNATGFDLGCGSGRWAQLVAPRVKELHCIDPSAAIEVAKKNLRANENCKFHKTSVDEMPFANASMDFGYSIGVLHHIPNTKDALAACTAKLKPYAPFLLYIYYAFDNRPVWFRAIWQFSDLLRKIISRMPKKIRYLVTQIIAAIVYFPLARISLLIEKLGFNVSNIPLSAYRKASFYTMRTDSLDRFGTILEQRFTKKQIKEMMEECGLTEITFSENAPFWCAIGYRKPD